MCIYTVTLHSRYQRVRPFVNSISMERKREIFCVCCCLRPNALVRQHPSAATKTSLINSCVNHKPILLSRESLLRRNWSLAFWLTHALLVLTLKPTVFQIVTNIWTQGAIHGIWAKVAFKCFVPRKKEGEMDVEKSCLDKRTRLFSECNSNRFEGDFLS